MAGGCGFHLCLAGIRSSAIAFSKLTGKRGVSIVELSIFTGVLCPPFGVGGDFLFCYFSGAWRVTAFNYSFPMMFFLSKTIFFYCLLVFFPSRL